MDSLANEHEVFTPHTARRHWRRLRERWVEAAKIVPKMVLAIEDTLSRKVCAMIIDAIAKDQGSYVLEPASEGFRVAEIELDDDAVDAILDVTGGDTDILDVAYDWIVALLQDMPAPFVAWAFGSMLLRGPVTNAAGETLQFFAFDRVVYSLKEKRLVGVHTHPDVRHPKNRVVPIDL